MQGLPSSIICLFIVHTAWSEAFITPPGVGTLHNRIFVRLRNKSGLSMIGDPISESEKSDLKEAEKESEAIKNKSLLRLAELSLEDYEWRQSVFSTNEADRKVEESLARMMGDEASYVRPMDASTEKIGPLVCEQVLLRSTALRRDDSHPVFASWNV